MPGVLNAIGIGFDANKAKPNLKMSMQRLQIDLLQNRPCCVAAAQLLQLESKLFNQILLCNKKAASVKVNKKEIARLLSEGKEDKAVHISAAAACNSSCVLSQFTLKSSLAVCVCFLALSTARIRVEQIIRDDETIEAYEILELQLQYAQLCTTGKHRAYSTFNASSTLTTAAVCCDLLAQRMRYIESEKNLPADLREAVCTIMWAADRTECDELTKNRAAITANVTAVCASSSSTAAVGDITVNQTVKDQFTKKYGRGLLDQALRDDDNCVHDKVITKLSVEPPTSELVQNYLIEIAAASNIDWKPRLQTVAGHCNHHCLAPAALD
eukprot:13834-Heterococcus_DN1.PRE.3